MTGFIRNSHFSIRHLSRPDLTLTGMCKVLERFRSGAGRRPPARPASRRGEAMKNIRRFLGLCIFVDISELFGRARVILTGLVCIFPSLLSAVEPGRVTRMSCNLAEPIPLVAYQDFDGGTNNPANSSRLNGFHYDIYLPAGYNESEDQRYPVIFIASPGGNARMGSMERALVEQGEWIVVMLVESRNGTTDWVHNFGAAHDDVVHRFRVLEDAKFATGMSGGARAASAYPLIRPGFRGIIVQAAGFVWGTDFDSRRYSRYPSHIAVAATFGDNDSNLRERLSIRRRLNPESSRRVDIFRGGHTWAPGDVFGESLDWVLEATFLSPDQEGEETRLFRPVPFIPLSMESREWYFLHTHRRFLAAEDVFERMFYLGRLEFMITETPLLKERSRIQRLLPELSIARRDASKSAFREAFDSALADYEKALAIRTSFHAEMTKRGNRGLEGDLSQKEARLLAEYRTILAAMKESAPGDFFARFAARRLASLGLEFD